MTAHPSLPLWALHVVQEPGRRDAVHVQSLALPIVAAQANDMQGLAPCLAVLVEFK